MMGAINMDKPGRWRRDIAESVDMYNAWFLEFAPDAFRSARVQATSDVETTLKSTNNMQNVGAELLRAKPSVLPSLRMSTCPPLAADRLAGLAGVSRNLIRVMEKEGRLPRRMPEAEIDEGLRRIGRVVEKMADPDLFVWLGRGDGPSGAELYRAATVVADRLCGAVANPLVRNAQEERQLRAIGHWLQQLGYDHRDSAAGGTYGKMKPGTYSYRLNVPVRQEDAASTVNVSVDVAIMPKTAKPGALPLLIEAKSAGDFTNVNKRRKEEAAKMKQLRHTYGDEVRYILLLCGYFDSGYLDYEAAEGIDWVWEHRLDDLSEAGL